MGFEGNGRNGCLNTPSGSGNVLVVVVKVGSCGLSCSECPSSCNVVEFWKDSCGVTCCKWS